MPQILAETNFLTATIHLPRSLTRLPAFSVSRARRGRRPLELPEARDPFAVFHMEGQRDADGTGMIAPIRAACDNPRLVATLGVEPHTPLAIAVRETLGGIGCLPGR